MGEGLVVIPYLAGVNIKLADLSGGGLAAAMPLGQCKFRRGVEGIGSLPMLCFGICSLAVEAPDYVCPCIAEPATVLLTRRRNWSGRFRGTTATASMGRVGISRVVGHGSTYNPPQVDRIWGIWGPYYNIPKAIFKGDYMNSHARIRELA